MLGNMSTVLRRQPQQYGFTENGVGCKQHGLPACLCDVDLNEVGIAPINFGFNDVGYADAATLLNGGMPADREEFVEWASWLLTAHDEMVARKVDALIDIVAAYRDSLSGFRKPEGDGGDWWRQRTAVFPLLAAGYDSEQIAEILTLELEEVTKFWSRNERQLPAIIWLRMENLILQGELSIPEILVDLQLLDPSVDRDHIHAHAQSMNATLPSGRARTMFDKDPALAEAMDKAIAAVQDSGGHLPYGFVVKIQKHIEQAVGQTVKHRSIRNELERRGLV